MQVKRLKSPVKMTLINLTKATEPCYIFLLLLHISFSFFYFLMFNLFNLDKCLIV